MEWLSNCHRSERILRYLEPSFSVVSNATRSKILVIFTKIIRIRTFEVLTIVEENLLFESPVGENKRRNSRRNREADGNNFPLRNL